MKTIRRTSLVLGLLCLFHVGCTKVDTAAEPATPDYMEWDIAAVQNAMDEGTLTSLQLVDYYLERIARIDYDGPTLRSVVKINPDAQTIADDLDAERAKYGPRGPLLSGGILGLDLAHRFVLGGVT